MAAFNQTRFNSTQGNSGQWFTRWLSGAMAISASLVQKFRPPRRLAQSATTRTVERY